MKFKYYTQDGHLMKNEEVMWRICDSTGFPYEKPASVFFHHSTGYNRGDEELNPFAANHLHYYDKETAEKELALLKLIKK